MSEQKFISAANLFGWGQSFNATGKFPIIAKRVWKTYNDMIAFVSDTSDVCTAGLVLTVVNDADAKKNGAYYVASCPTLDNPEITVEVQKIGDGTGSLSIANFTITDGKIQEATADNVGQIIYITTGTTDYPAGPYIVTGDGEVAKLGTTTASGDLAGDVTTLKGKVATLEGDENTTGSVDNKIKTAIDKIDLSPYAKSADVESTYVKKEGYVEYTQTEKDKLAGIAENAQVNVIEKVIFNGNEVVVDAQTKTITLTTPQDTVRGLADGEKVLSLDTESGKLGTTLSIEYFRDSADENRPKMRLKGVNGEQVGDAIDVSDFVKDGMLSNVELVENPEGKTGTYLRFTWNSDSEIASTDLNVTDLVDVYVAGDGVSIDGKTVKAKAKADDKYIEVTTEGIASKGIDSAITTAKNELVGNNDTDTKDSLTVYGVRKYADDKAAAINTTLTEYKVKDVDSTASSGVSLTLADNKVGVSVNANDLASALVTPAGDTSLINANNISLGTAALGLTSADTVVTAFNKVTELIDAKHEDAISTINGDSYLTAVKTTGEDGNGSSVALTLSIENVAAALVDENSAISAKEGKLVIEWTEVE